MTKQIAFVFPGQGSQTVGMLAELATTRPMIVLETFGQASKVLGYDLWQLTQNGPESALNQTERTQPALLTASVAIWRIWQSLNAPMPILLAGHSLGEYSALVCAEALDFEAAIQLVANRGRYMQEAVPEGQGAMAAIIGLDNDVIQTLCTQAAQGEIIAPANYNAIGQTVIAGQTAAVQRAIELAKSAGAKIAKLIPVSVPSHSELMRPAAERMQLDLAKVEFKKPRIPVIQNVDVKAHDTVEQIRRALVQQLYSPVRWVETIQQFNRDGVNLIIECGPGKILAGLIKRIEPDLTTYSLNTPEQIQAAIEK